MSLSPADIIEAIVDELAMGELVEAVEAVQIRRTEPGCLILDYGKAGRFRLDVVEASER